MTQIDFQPIFDYIDRNNEVLEEKIMRHVRIELDPIKTTLDNALKEMKDFREQQEISGHRISRLEDWTSLASKEIEIPFVT